MFGLVEDSLRDEELRFRLALAIVLFHPGRVILNLAPRLGIDAREQHERRMAAMCIVLVGVQ